MSLPLSWYDVWGKANRRYFDRNAIRDERGIMRIPIESPDDFISYERLRDGFRRTVSLREFVTDNAHHWNIVDERLLDFATGKILDLGCGSGRFSRYLLDLQRGKVIAIDGNPDMVAIAQARGVDARLLQFSELGTLKPETFDTILAYGVLESLSPTEILTLLQSLTRLRSLGGILLGTSYYLKNVPEHETELRLSPTQFLTRVTYEELTSESTLLYRYDIPTFRDAVTASGWSFRLIAESDQNLSFNDYVYFGFMLTR